MIFVKFVYYNYYSVNLISVKFKQFPASRKRDILLLPLPPFMHTFNGVTF